MPTTILASFATFKQNLEITDLQSETVSTRQKNVREVLERDLEVVESFLSGSYIRSTMISPLKEADIDIIVVLNPKYYNNYTDNQNNGQAGLLDLVKRTLKKTYTSTPDISRDGQAVTIRFTDFIVDVVPAFNRQGGGYIIANSISKKWISTDPKKHVELISSANKIHNGNLVPLIKMIKSWNRQNDKHFNSFHLEVLSLSIFTNVTITDFPSGLRYFFEKGKDLINQKNFDPAGYGGDVGAYINTYEKIQIAVNKFQVAYERALQAEYSAAQGQIQIAVNAWIGILGDYFPAYG